MKALRAKEAGQGLTLLLLTSGREEFLTEMLTSIALQTTFPRKLVLVNDGVDLRKGILQPVKTSVREIVVTQTATPGSGQWAAFRLGLKTLGAEGHPFVILHDDDRLKTDFVETLVNFSKKQRNPWICSHNLEVFTRESPQRCLILPQEETPLVFSDKEEVCLHYSRSFLPFPGTCFGISPAQVAERVHEKYKEMADAVLLCECAEIANIFYEPRPIYEYRRHEGQVSDRMNHDMEDQLQDYLLGATRGTRAEERLATRLEKRRAERYFSWVWEKKSFRNYPHNKKFHWSRTLRCVRNRKLLALKIGCQDLARSLKSWLQLDTANA